MWMWPQVVGQNLHEAQKLQKKHDKLEAELDGHKPMIDKTILQGAEYVKEKHPQSEKVWHVIVMWLAR